MRILRGVGIGFGALLLVIAAVVFGARFADGPPLELLAGGPFKTGQWVEASRVDWAFASQIDVIELQSGTPLRSRKTWILVLEGEAYVPCSLEFPPGKSWHRQALEDPAAVVRIEGRRYRRSLRKVEDASLHQRLFDAVQAKYGGGPSSEPSQMWFFRLAPPA